MPRRGRRPGRTAGGSGATGPDRVCGGGRGRGSVGGVSHSLSAEPDDPDAIPRRRSTTSRRGCPGPGAARPSRRTGTGPDRPRGLPAGRPGRRRDRPRPRHDRPVPVRQVRHQALLRRHPQTVGLRCPERPQPAAPRRPDPARGPQHRRLTGPPPARSCLHPAAWWTDG